MRVHRHLGGYRRGQLPDGGDVAVGEDALQAHQGALHMFVAGLKAQLAPDPGGNAITHDVDPHAFQLLCNRHAILGGHLADSSLKKKSPLPTPGKGTSSAVPALSTHPSAPSTGLNSRIAD